MHRSVRVALPLFFLCLTGVVLPAVASNPEAESLIGMWGGGVGQTDPTAGRWSGVTVRFDEIETFRVWILRQPVSVLHNRQIQPNRPISS